MNREKLKIDTDFISSLNIPQERKDQLNEYLLIEWLLHSQDSPWYNQPSEEDIEMANNLVKFSQQGISNEWNGEHTVFNDVGQNIKRYNLRPRKT